MVTDQFEMFKDELCLCDWYLFPIDVQRMLIVAMANAQQRTYIQGYANTLCARITFKQVCIVFNLTEKKSYVKRIQLVDQFFSIHVFRISYLDDSCELQLFYGVSSNGNLNT